MGRHKGDQERHLAQFREEGKPAPREPVDYRELTKAWFHQTAHTDMQAVYEATFESATGLKYERKEDGTREPTGFPPDPRAQKLLFESHMGKPKEEQGGLQMDQIMRLIELVTSTRSAGVSERYIDVE